MPYSIFYKLASQRSLECTFNSQVSILCKQGSTEENISLWKNELSFRCTSQDETVTHWARSQGLLRGIRATDVPIALFPAREYSRKSDLVA